MRPFLQKRAAWFLPLIVVTVFVPRARADGPDPSVSPTRAIIERYAIDAAALDRSNVRLGDAGRQRTAAFLREQLAALDQLDFDKLDADGRVDDLLLRTKLAFELKDLDHDQKQWTEVAPLLPFAPAIIDLEAA